jgi:DNA sulfur modification protein DndC
MDGRLTLMNDPEKGGKKLVHGPYLQSYREEMLHALLVAQEKVRDSGEPGTEAYQVITDEELEEIRRIWVVEKNEIEDRVPEIYKNATNRQYPYDQIDDSRIFNRTDLELLKNIASPNNSIDDLHYQLVRNLLNVERNYSTAIKRVGIYENLEKILINNGFTDGKEALAYAIDKESSILEDKDRYPGYFHANQMDDDVEPFVTELNNNQSNGEINAP